MNAHMHAVLKTDIQVRMRVRIHSPLGGSGFGSAWAKVKAQQGGLASYDMARVGYVWPLVGYSGAQRSKIPTHPSRLRCERKQVIRFAVRKLKEY